MRRLTVLWLALNLGLTGCAAMMPGYTPVPPKNDAKLKAAQTGGGFDTSGSYSLTDQEQKLDCKHLTGSVTVKILQMREAQNRPKPSAVTQLAQKTTQQVAKPFNKNITSYGMDTDEDYKRDRARLETMNKQLDVKSCRMFDLDAELKPGNTAMPVPIGEAKANGQKK